MKINPIAKYPILNTSKINNNGIINKTNPISINVEKRNYYPISFGFYQDKGWKRCGRFPGVYGFLDSDKLDKKHLEQVLNFLINEKVSGDIEPVQNYTYPRGLRELGFDMSESLWQVCHKEKVTVGEVEACLKNVLKDTPKILSGGYKSIKDYIKYDEYNTIKIKREFAKKMIDKLSKFNPDKEYTSTVENRRDFFKNIIDEMYDDNEKKFENYSKGIKNKIRYELDDNEERFDVADELEKLPKEDREKFKREYGSNISEICQNYLARRGSIDYIGKSKYVNLDTAILQTLPRYQSRKNMANNKAECFERKPLYRWLKVDNPEEFLKDFRVGCEYSYPASQSCSNSPDGAEIWYGDHRKEQNVKFRIHPKGKTFKAYDFSKVNCNTGITAENYDDLCPVYRYSEVIYPANTKFKVLGIYKDYLNANASCDNFKIIIDLQEV